jgi:2-isopropylmalate synthase
MITDPSTKYRPFPGVHLPNRQWPSRELTAAPIWCSVDLRDGNQALAVPMNVSQKLELFDALVKCGFKQIEVGFPSASNTEFAFNRRLIEDKRIPDDVTIQCLVQAREHLIERTVESLMGAKSVIIHLYNSTSPAQRKHVFNMSKEEIIAVAVQGAQWVKDRIHRLEDTGTQVMLQYSPESFSATEVEFAKEISEAVMDVWQPTAERKMILNLPDTVEMAGPNVYADQIEWMCTHIRNREALIISLHTHNDRGTGTAATELGLLAGADRVEGTLFGNGERTGNLDIVQTAMNLYMHGVNPKLDFSDMNGLIKMYERCTGMTVPPRQPYSGELVFTAFSGSHQDAIKKGLTNYEREIEICKTQSAPAIKQGIEAFERAGGTFWDVPYLTIDPQDIGRNYREVIRVNSQSGKGGVAYLLESDYGINLPKDLQREFGPLANDLVDSLGREVTAAELKDMFWKEYVERNQPWRLDDFSVEGKPGAIRCQATLAHGDSTVQLKGEGNGPIAAFVQALTSHLKTDLEITHYSEHSLGSGAGAQAIAYIQLNGKIFGAGVDTSIELASIHAVLSALNRRR